MNITDNDFEKTKLAFVQNPLHSSYPDIIYKTGDLVYENDLGEYIFLGRKDSQIKHMGYRIELGEIETAIIAINGVKNACVLYDDNLKQTAKSLGDEFPEIHELTDKVAEGIYFEGIE